MENALACHGVVDAMEARSGWTPMVRFAAAVGHAINGHLAYHRYHAAGLARAADGTGADSVERLIVDFLATNLNPAVTFFTSFRNGYNESAAFGVRIQVVGGA